MAETDDELLEELPPLNISCTSTKCEDDLHCFKATKKMQKEQRQGTCRECGVDLIDWTRVRQRELGDVDNTFSSLRREYIRHHFWHVTIDQRAIDHATRKGRAALHEAARRRLETSVGRAGSAWDGRQTPFAGNTIFYAQHATASCCRKCIEYWHGVPADEDLSNDELTYLYELVVRYLDERLPDLEEGGKYVAPRRR